MKVKVLWLSNISFSEESIKGSGTWLHSASKFLLNSNEIILHNITNSNIDKITRSDYGGIQQWLIPFENNFNNGLPSSSTVNKIVGIINEIKPDIIHIWGVESYWGLLSARGYIAGNVILEIQGLKHSIYRHFFSGLSLIESFRCLGLRDILRPKSSILGTQFSFFRWSIFEYEIIKSHKFILVQSNWVEYYIRNINPEAQILKSKIYLRDEFLSLAPWKYDICNPLQIFSPTSGVISYKGLHILIKAIFLLKNKYPLIALRIASPVPTGIFKPAYYTWIKSLITNLGLDSNVIWLGELNASEIAKEIVQANVVVITSLIESYSVSLDEALMLGAPVVCSFAGAMPEMAVHEKSAFFFPPGDIASCANSIEKLLIQPRSKLSHHSESFITTIASNARKSSLLRQEAKTKFSYIEEYRKLIGEEKS
jgi:glycosyltransferase involved in cell wall biosynthesis